MGTSLSPITLSHPNLKHDLDPRGNPSDDANTKQKGSDHNVAYSSTKQSSSDTSNKQLSILKFNQLFTKRKGDTHAGGNVSSKKAKETNASANVSVQRQIKDVWFEMYTWLEKTPDFDGNVKLHCTYCKADSRSQSDFGTTGCSSFKKDTLRKNQISMKHRLAQDRTLHK